METTIEATATEAPVRVEIANLRDNERLLYPLVLVEGYVVPLAADGPPAQFIEAGLAAGAPGASMRSWPVVPETGHFKAFVMLPRPGKHDIQLHVRGSLARVLTVRYARAHTKHFARFHYQQEPNATRGFDVPPGVDNSDEEALKRVRLGALLTQTCIAELYHKQGLPRATIALEFDDSAEFQIPLANLLMTQVNPDDPIDSIQDALNLQNASARRDGISLSHFVHVGSNHYDPETEQVAGHCAHVYGNSYIFSSVTLYAWPSTLDELAKCCLDNTEVDTRTLQDDSVERGTYWANFATGLGVFMHLFLRSARVYDNGEGMFGRGFDNVNRLLSVYEPVYESQDPAITNLSSREEGSEGDSSAPPLELNYDVLEPVGADMEGAYVEEATLHSLTEVCPFITSASKLTQAQKNAAAAA